MSSLNVLLIIALYFALWTFSPSLFINSHISHFGVENSLILLQWNDLLDEQTAVSIIYLNFGKVFPTVSHNKTLNEADEVWGGGQSMRWIENWLKGWAQGGMIYRAKSIWRYHQCRLTVNTGCGPVHYHLKDFCLILVFGIWYLVFFWLVMFMKTKQKNVLFTFMYISYRYST